MKSNKFNILLRLLAACAAICAALLLVYGNGITFLNNSNPWGLIIIAAQCFVTAGCGTFFAVFLFYIFRADNLKPTVNVCLHISLISSVLAFALLLLNAGRPFFAWYGMFSPAWGVGLLPTNAAVLGTYSMLVFFCFVLIMLFIERLNNYNSADIKNKPALHPIKKFLWAFSAAAMFFAFFMYGSLGATLWQGLRPLPFVQSLFACIAVGALLLLLLPSLKESSATVALIAKISFPIYFTFNLACLALMLFSNRDNIIFFASAALEIILGIVSMLMLYKKHIQAGATLGLAAAAVEKLTPVMQTSLPVSPVELIIAIGSAAFAVLAYDRLYKKSKGISNDTPLQQISDTGSTESTEQIEPIN